MARLAPFGAFVTVTAEGKSADGAWALAEIGGRVDGGSVMAEAVIYIYIYYYNFIGILDYIYFM